MCVAGFCGNILLTDSNRPIRPSMDKQTGDLHLRVVLAGEPSLVRSAFNARFVPYAERASIKHHWRLRFTKRSNYSSGVVDLGKVTRGSKSDAEAALARVCQMMDPGDIPYAETVMNAVHKAITNRRPIEDLRGSHPRFWLEIEAAGDAPKLLAAVKSTTFLATIHDSESSMYVREGRPPRPVLRSFAALQSIRTLAPEHLDAALGLHDDVSDILQRAAAAREAVVKVRAQTVLGDLADDWLENGRRMRYTPWSSFYDNYHWLDLVELDFLEANLDQYRELRTRSLADKQRYWSDWAPTFPVQFGEDDNETEPSTE
jgi:hypothetical protein